MTEVRQQQCRRCKNLHPETLYSGRDGLCVYCKADEAEAMPSPAAPSAEQIAQQSVEEKARAELAMRLLTRKRLLPFVERFNADYQAGWVHKDVC